MRAPAAAIEALRERDIEAIAAIHETCFDDAWSPQMMRRILATIGAFGLVARAAEDGPVAAFALGRVIADECELLSLGVAPEARRAGLGAALLDAAMATALSRRASRFFLEVGEFNQPARALYGSRGLVAVGRRRGYYDLADGGKMDALTMRIELDPVTKASRFQTAVADSAGERGAQSSMS